MALTHTGTRTLQTPRLVLRRFTADDAQDMYENWAADPQVCRFMTWPPHESAQASRAVLTRWAEAYADPAQYQWAIVWRESGHVMGSISVVDVNDAQQHCEVGYCLSRALWNRGVMTEALTAVLGELFDGVGMHRVEARHDTRNPASGRVMEKAGLRREGTLRQRRQDRSGDWIDLTIWSILADEWAAR